MSRMYEMTVDIKDYRARSLKKIMRACCEEWDFDPDDFTQDRIYDPPSPRLRRARRVIATAQGSLCGGEGEHEFADRLVRAIWKANGGYCHVAVHATYLDDQPYETYTFSEEDYARLTRR